MSLENAKNTKEDNDSTCATQHEAYSKVMYKWIIDLGIAKHMTSHMITFNTHEVIASLNTYLDDDSVMKMMRMDFILVKVLMGVKIKKINIKDALHVPKLQVNLFLVDNFCWVE
jgi:hypothetical protein